MASHLLQSEPFIPIPTVTHSFASLLRIDLGLAGLAARASDVQETIAFMGPNKILPSTLNQTELTLGAGLLQHLLQ